jgi:succinyl-CoA synthetase beta subunit
MKLHEFQAKELLARYGVPIPRGRVAGSAEDAERVALRLGLPRFVVKAQIHAGDRLANGGIRFAGDPGAVRDVARQLIGRPLVTSQTGPSGQRVRWVYIEEAVQAPRHLYCAVTLDRGSGELLLLASTRGGEDIEAKIGQDPSSIVKLRLDLAGNAIQGDFGEAARRLGVSASETEALAALFSRLAVAARESDATLVEINPLAVTEDGRLVALDAKIVIDDNALFRHPNIAALREADAQDEGDPVELEAQRHQINYLRTEGNIGVVVNGAGLALATIDLLHEAGGKPANFMDIRTTASSLDIAYGFELILTNPAVDAVLVNVHGGGMQRCDTIADGIGVAVHRARRSLPMVVRLAGNNAEFAITRLNSYGIRFVEAVDMWDAAKRAVALARRSA